MMDSSGTGRPESTREQDDKRMYPGEIVVARISGGASIRRCLETDGGQVRISLGRNRQARIPRDRILLSTGVSASTEEEVEEFRQRCLALSSEIDLTEVWELVCDDSTPLSLDDLGELYWAQPLDARRKAALLLHLEQSNLHFAERTGVYVPRSRDDVEEILARRTRQAENARSDRELIDCLSEGSLPTEMNQHQRVVLEHMRGFAVHGDDYTRSEAVRGLLEQVAVGSRDLQRLSFDLLVGVGVFSQDEYLELARAGIERELPQPALAESKEIELASLLEEPHRRDLTDLPVITIDDADTEDRDDAISLERLPEGYRVGIHIADAGSLVRKDSALDNEADRRMATLYLPEEKVSMLPPRVSGYLGSLVPGERRVSLSLIAHVSDTGEVLEWEAVPSVIRSQAALSYEEADRAIEDDSRPWHDLLAGLGRVAHALRERRQKAGALVIERREMRVDVSDSGVVGVTVVRRSPARRLVTEMMVLCNSLLAEFCRAEGVPATYRSQRAPDLSDLDLDSSAGVALDEDPVRMFTLMRRLPQVDVSTTPAAHAGLGVSAYIQATSPLRRYPDLVMQRQISHFLSTGTPLYSEEATASVAARAETQLKELSRIEEGRRRYWFLKYLQQTRLGPSGQDTGSDMFQAIVLANQPRRPALLELCEYPFRVRVQLTDAEAPGDNVTLRLHGIDLWKCLGQFVQVRQSS